MTATNNNQPRIATLILAFLVFVGIVVFLNLIINHQVEEATVTLDQSQMKPPKLMVVNKPVSKAKTSETVAVSEDNSSAAEETQLVVEKTTKKNKVVYEMPINDEALPQ
jgi:hypothetical protein